VIDSDITNGLHLHLVCIKTNELKQAKKLFRCFGINLIKHVVIEFDGDKYYPLRPRKPQKTLPDCFGKYNYVYDLDVFLSNNEKWNEQLYRNREFYESAVEFWYRVMREFVDKFGEFKFWPDYYKRDELGGVSMKEIFIDEWTDLVFLKRDYTILIVMGR